MARIKIKDLPEEMEVSKDMMKKIHGGPNRREHDHIGRIESPILLSRESAGGEINYIGIIDIPS
jgi:hypothetical protein